MTTLYFEAEREDDLRKVGYSKERRVDPQVIVGLLVDRAGFQHLAVLHHHDPVGEHACSAGDRAAVAAVLAHAEQRFDREQLRPRIAAAVLGLATGPFRVQVPGWAEVTRDRIELAARWLA